MRYRMLWVLGVCLVSVTPVAAQTVDMGTTFHEAERQATRVVTWFDDSYAVSERQADGQLVARLFDKRTNAVVAEAERNERTAESGRIVEVRLGNDRVALAVGPDRSLGADWHHGQLRRLWREDRARHARGRPRGPLVWHEGSFGDADLAVRRRQGETPDPDEGIEAVATEFPGMVVIAERDRHGRTHENVSYSTFTARLLSVSTGREIGFVRWFARARVVTWKFPDGAEGVIMESRVPGGFTFNPSMAWANVQATLFLRESLTKSADKMLRPAASRWAAGLSVHRASAGGSCDGASDGCTGMHWLDGTAFRECCDSHDRCFEADQSNCCTAWSWLAFWERSDCSMCNLQVVGCFISTAFGGGGGGGSDGGGDGGGGGGGGSCSDGSVCTRCMGDWCPPECSQCGNAQ